MYDTPVRCGWCNTMISEDKQLYRAQETDGKDVVVSRIFLFGI